MKLGMKLLAVMTVAFILAGCGGVRKDIAYFPADGKGARLSSDVTAVLLPVTDARESAKIYPKQIISHTSYYGEKSFDINNKPVDEVFQDALALELYNLGVGVVKAEDIDQTLEKENKDAVRDMVRRKYPEAQVVIGLKVQDFMAYSKRNFLTTDVRFIAAVQLNVMDLSNGELLWADYKTEKTDTVLSASRNYKVDELDAVLAEVMKKAVKNNLTLRDALVKASSH